MRPEQRNLFTNAKLIGHGIDPDVYHRSVGGQRGEEDFIMSRSALATFVQCPSKWRAGYESRDTTATKWGSLLDTLVLSPSSFEKRFAIYPDMYPCEPTTKDPRKEKPWNNNATFCKDWKHKHAGKAFIYREKVEEDGSPDEDTKTATFGNAERAVSRLLADERIKSILTCSNTQVMVTAEYRDRPTGLVIPFKVLLDIVPELGDPEWGKCLADFKTARSAEEEEFAKAVHSCYYDWQAAIYRDCYVAATGEDRTDFLLAVLENTPPYEPALWAIGSDWLEDARMEVRLALEYYCDCLVNNHWPGYPISTPIASWGALSREAWMLRNIPRPLSRGKQVSTPLLHEQEIIP